MEYDSIKEYLEKHQVPEITPNTIKVIIGNYCNVYGDILGKKIIIELDNKKATAYSDHFGIFMSSGIIGSGYISEKNIEGIYNISVDAIKNHELLSTILNIAKDPFGLKKMVCEDIKITQPPFNRYGIDYSEIWHPGGLF